MSTKTVAPTNGKAAEVKTSTPATIPSTAKIAPIKIDTPEKKQLSDLPPLEDRVLKVQQLSDLVEKREKLNDSLKKLKSIKTSSSNRDLKITIEDENNEWETYNTDAIKACIASMEQTIKQKLEEVENLIKF